jgi:hypothetical protein
LSRQTWTDLPVNFKDGYDPAMSIILPAFAVAFSAFCVWLAVRIVNRRERWAKWTLAVTLSLPVLYAVSFGPACWITSRVNVGVPVVNVIYLPMLWIRDVSPEFIGDGILWYSRIGSARGWCWSGDHEWMDFSDLFFGD